jgi:hypothetical protein
VEDDARVQVAETACLDRAVGRLEQDGETGLVDDLGAVEETRERVELRRQLLLAENDERHVELRLDAARVQLARQLEQDGEAALHVARAEADDGAVLDPPGNVVLRRHRVVVAGEDDELAPLPAPSRVDAGVLGGVLGLEGGRYERSDIGCDLLLVAALGGDVHELERSRREAVAEPCGERRHAPSVAQSPV